MEKKDTAFLVVAVIILINLIVLDFMVISALGFLGDWNIEQDRETRKKIDNLDFKLESNTDPCDFDSDCEQLWSEKGITCQDSVQVGVQFNGSLVCGNNICECRGTYSGTGMMIHVSPFRSFYSGLKYLGQMFF